MIRERMGLNCLLMREEKWRIEKTVGRYLEAWRTFMGHHWRVSDSLSQVSRMCWTDVLITVSLLTRIAPCLGARYTLTSTAQRPSASKKADWTDCLIGINSKIDASHENVGLLHSVVNQAGVRLRWNLIGPFH